jgi:integrase
MARPKAKAPARTFHISGQSIVRINGKDYYLGKHDSPESIARYAVLIAIYQANGLKLPDDFDQDSLETQAASLLGSLAPQTVATDQTKQPILVKHITAEYRDYIKKTYPETSAEVNRLTGICDELDKHDGDLEASEYGPLALQRQRQRWIDSNKARVYCNRLTDAVKRMWKHAVSQELVKPEAWQRLCSVESLRAGRTKAHEKEPIGPVDIAVVRATAMHLSPIVKSMLRIQIATGMRPSEICKMTPAEIDRSGEVWIYRPKKHKTAHKGKTKEIPLIGDARDAITDYLNRDPHAYCFSPKESVAWKRALNTANRVTPLSCGNRPGKRSGTNESKGGKPRSPGECFTHTSYRQAIQRAAKAAKVPKWHPYQLRHLAATVIREALGVEAAQAALGHSHPNMTQRYAELSLEKAIEAARVAPRL